jgi:hypothetical protein
MSGHVPRRDLGRADGSLRSLLIKLKVERYLPVAEESFGAGNQRESIEERLEARLNRIEQEVLKENRWWRGGLIVALVFLALSILIAGHHRRPRPMGMPGWGGPAGMAYGGYGPYPPPPRPRFGWDGPCGRDAWGPPPWEGQPRQWGPPIPQGPQDQAPTPSR